MPANQSFSRPATSSGVAVGGKVGDAYRRSSTSMMRDIRPMTPKSGLMMQVQRQQDFRINRIDSCNAINATTAVQLFSPLPFVADTRPPQNEWN